MTNPKYEISPYKEIYKEDFKTISIEWVKDMFVPEAHDLKVILDPKKYILDRNGMIYFAIKDGKAVGACALVEIEEAVFELTKMGVLKSERGEGLGRFLLEHIINNVFDTSTNKYFLLTNHDCKAAIHLYKEYGFEYNEAVLKKYGDHYKRANVGMIYKVPLSK